MIYSVFFLIIYLFDFDGLTPALVESLAVRGRGATQYLGITIKCEKPGTHGGKHDIILLY